MKRTLAAAVAIFVLAACAGHPDASPVLPALNANNASTQAFAGTFREFKIPTAASKPYDIAIGPDRNFWFTEQQGNNVARMTPTGVFATFIAPDAASMPTGIAAGS